MNVNGRSSGVIGIAIIGIGRIGKVHVSNILSLPGVKLCYIIDSCKKFAVDYIEEYGLTSTQALSIEDINIAFDDDRVDAVVVCCPTASHEIHVKSALNKGKAVMCEKPLSFSLESIFNCYKIAHEAKQILFCAFNKRFDPQSAAIQSEIPKFVGKVKVVKTVSRDHPRNSIEYLKTSGGIILDMAIHDIDMLIWLSGQIPETIHAIGHAHVDEIGEMNDVDQLFIIMKFPNGALGHIDVNREAKYGHDQRIEVFGSKGMLNGNNIRPMSHEIHTDGGAISPPIHNSCMSRYNDSYKQEMIHFIDVVKGNTVSKVTGYDTVWTTLCCHAANESLATGETVNVQEFVSKKFPNLSLEQISKWSLQ